MDVRGGAQPAGWHYTLTKRGPSESTSVSVPAAGVLSFRTNSDHRTPWRGRGALAASNSTGALLGAIEGQFRLESDVRPARVVSGNFVKEQRNEVTGAIKLGGIVTITGVGMGSRDGAGGLSAGIVRGEVSAAGVNLHEELTRVICSTLGVPSDLILAGSEAGSRESFRRFAAATIAPLLAIVQRPNGN